MSLVNFRGMLTRARAERAVIRRKIEFFGGAGRC